MTRRPLPTPSAALLCLLACGCSTVREIPRGEYAVHAERENVRVETRGGTRYDFERVQIAGDSLQGMQREEVDGAFDVYHTVGLPLDEVARMSVRRIDWYRTWLIAGVAAAVVLAAVLSQAGGDEGGEEPPQGPCGPRPCP